MGLNRILDIGLSGLYASSAAMQTASHNIANVNTEGFSRQSVITGSRTALNQSYGMLGGGSDVLAVRRMTDDYLLGRLRSQTAQLGHHEQTDLAMQEVELVLGPSDDNPIGTALDRFFASWSELSSPPITDELRRDVLDNARLLAGQLSTAADGLGTLATDMESRLEDGVTQLNDLLAGVARLNGQILRAEGPGDSANDLRDQRDYLLSELSKLTDLDVVARSDETIDVVIAGRTVVVRDTATPLAVGRSEDGEIQVTAGSRGYPVNITDGELGGLVDAVTSRVADVRTHLDAFAADLIARVNEIHVQGRTAGGPGLIFFTGSGAADIGINPALLENEAMVATSRSGLAGDNDIALEISALGEDVPGGGLRGLPSIYGDMFSDVASVAAADRLQLESQQQAVDALASRIESVRGVSLDEEAANIARYQNTYAASAKVVEAAQNMFDTVLSIF